MLAFELYLKNRDHEGEFVKRVKPIKKIFGKNVRLDTTTPNEYGIQRTEKQSEFAPLIHVLSMPLNTAENLGLPYKVTGANSPKPYVELYGLCELGKSRKTVYLSVGKDDGFKAELDIVSGESKISASGKIRLNIDKDHYFMKNKSLFSEYVKSKILTNDSEYSSMDFRKAAEAVFKLILRKWDRDFEQNYFKRIPFSIIILPSNKMVSFRAFEEKNEKELSAFVDSFGVTTNAYATKPTLTAKFLSYDDPAFSLNCKGKSEFYQNLGIGEKSHGLINMPQDDVFVVAGLNWMFADVVNPDLGFEKTGKGIYYQLWKNYVKLKNQGSSFFTKSQVKVMCFKISQAKLELLLDENLTMPQMEQIFSTIGPNEEPPAMALEVLIDNSKKANQWSEYLIAVRYFLSRRHLQRDYFLSRLTFLLRQKIFDWIEQKTNHILEAEDFFLRSEFCIKVLTDFPPSHSIMNSSEDYAFRVGKIAQEYIQFKESVGEKSNSLRDILSFSRYDREKLRFVVQRVGLGISLSKASEEEIKTISEYIKKEISQTEIPDSEAHNDLSYFFYKGVFGREKQ